MVNNKAAGMFIKVKAKAVEKGGECISTAYINQDTKLTFKCRREHQWDTTPKSLLRGSWCGKCAVVEIGENKKLGIEAARESAREKGGECLTNEYTNSNVNMKWKCGKNHEWETTYAHIRAGSWCRKCFDESRMMDIQFIQKYAADKGGRLISGKYECSTIKLTWECENKHVWDALLTNIIHGGNWCPRCTGYFDYSVESITALAEGRGGTCLSDEYVNCITKMRFKCERGHVWETTPRLVQYGSWCPHCPRKNETYCKLVFEKLFDREFLKRRPDWLINPLTGTPMELDGYCEYESLAFEYNGEQHYKYIEFYHNDYDDFLKQQMRDKAKVDLCDRNVINLIVIPYLCNTKATIDKFVVDVLRNVGYEFDVTELVGLKY